jgi:hypothetical protein
MRRILAIILLSAISLQPAAFSLSPSAFSLQPSAWHFQPSAAFAFTLDGLTIATIDGRVPASLNGLPIIPTIGGHLPGVGSLGSYGIITASGLVFAAPAIIAQGAAGGMTGITAAVTYPGSIGTSVSGLGSTGSGGSLAATGLIFASEPMTGQGAQGGSGTLAAAIWAEAASALTGQGAVGGASFSNYSQQSISFGLTGMGGTGSRGTLAATGGTVAGGNGAAALTGTGAAGGYGVITSSGLVFASGNLTGFGGAGGSGLVSGEIGIVSASGALTGQGGAGSSGSLLANGLAYGTASLTGQGGAGSFTALLAAGGGGSVYANTTFDTVLDPFVKINDNAVITTGQLVLSGPIGAAGAPISVTSGFYVEFYMTLSGYGDGGQMFITDNTAAIDVAKKSYMLAPAKWDDEGSPVTDLTLQELDATGVVTNQLVVAIADPTTERLYRIEFTATHITVKVAGATVMGPLAWTGTRSFKRLVFTKQPTPTTVYVNSAAMGAL